MLRQSSNVPFTETQNGWATCNERKRDHPIRGNAAGQKKTANADTFSSMNKYILFTIRIYFLCCNIILRNTIYNK